MREETAGEGGAVAGVGRGEGSEEGGEEFGSGVGGRRGGEGPEGWFGGGGGIGRRCGCGRSAGGHAGEEFFAGEVGVDPVVSAVADGVDLAFQAVLSGGAAVRGRGGDGVDVSLEGYQPSETRVRRKHGILHYQFVEDFVVEGLEIGWIVEVLEVRVVAEMDLGVKIDRNGFLAGGRWLLKGRDGGLNVVVASSLLDAHVGKGRCG